MGDVMVLVEHRRGEIKEVTWEMLYKAQDVAGALSGGVLGVLLGKGIDGMAEEVKKFCDKLIVVKDDALENFVSEPYQEVLGVLIERFFPSLLMVGHTAMGMEFAPYFSASKGIPIATDCYDVQVKDGKIVAFRQVYGGKLCAEVHLKGSSTCMVTIRPGSFPSEGLEEIGGSIEEVSVDLSQVKGKRFLGYIEAEAAEVDITQADIIVSVGRGIGDPENIPMAEELAKMLGGVVACSRPVADKKWLPKERQVGTSGKTVKPKLYLALGISGAFQHVAGMKNSGTIIAVNKDPQAPIFSVAHYGVVDDLFNVVPALIAKIKEKKGA